MCDSNVLGFTPILRSQILCRLHSGLRRRAAKPSGDSQRKATAGGDGGRTETAGADGGQRRLADGDGGRTETAGGHGGRRREAATEYQAESPAHMCISIIQNLMCKLHTTQTDNRLQAEEH